MTETTNAATSFRQDINGLRAWAVVAVVLFHFGVPGFAGGFIGVDIFFVISGFLMTGIIVDKLERGRFSLSGFYMARAKRLIPALAVLCFTLLVLGWFVLLPVDYKALASHAAYSMFFLSNVEYWQTTGYFDVGAHEKWLLHTWSLAVEWQFYLVLPLVLWTAWRCKPGRAVQLQVIAGGMAASFLACVAITRSDSVSAFFLLHSRAWEMLAGGVVYLLGGRFGLSPLQRRWFQHAGLSIIIASNLILDKSWAWPGAAAALPVLAAMLVLLANRDSVWTGARAAQWIGDRSYSIYLWHWPVYVALVYVELRSNPWALAAGVAATFALGHLSYRWIENWSRACLREKPLAYSVAAAGVFVVAVALPAVAVWKLQGVNGRFGHAVEQMAAESTNVNRRTQCHTTGGTASALCSYGPGKHKLIVIGDSHAHALVSGVASALAPRDVEIVQLSYSACPFVLGLKLTPAVLAHQPRDYLCSDFIGAAAARVAAEPPSTAVVIINRYAVQAFGPNELHDGTSEPRAYFTKIHTQATAEYLNEFSRAITQTACELAKHRQVYLMRPVPEMGIDVPKTLARRMSFGVTSDASIPMADYQRRNGWVWAAQDAARDNCGVAILDPLPYLCKGGQCFGNQGGRSLYYDDDHLSEYGNKVLAPMYLDAFRLPAVKAAQASLPAP